MDAERRDPGSLERQFKHAASPHLRETVKPEPTLDLEPPQGPPVLSLGSDDAQEPEREKNDQLVARVREMQEALTRTLNRAAKAREIDLGRGR